jgi:hypothetical protein
MKGYLLTIYLLLTVICSTQAQCRYDFSVAQDTYQPLTTGTSLSGTLRWDDINFKRALGFGFELDWMPVNTYSLVCNSKGQFLGGDTTSLLSGFCLMDADLQDRGKMDTIARSPIRYAITGNAGSRIFKIEFFNAGFWREKELYNTMEDSLNMQVWLYEGSNAIELRYGPAKISHASDYFIYGGNPVIGFVRDAGLFSLNLSKLYYLKGSPGSPVMDSCGSNITNVSSSLTSYPPEGTVYRFQPRTNSINNVTGTLQHIRLLNNITSTALHLHSEYKDITYQVVSLNGTINAKGQLTSGNQQLDVSQLPAGTYLLKLTGAEGNNTARFTKL